MHAKARLLFSSNPQMLRFMPSLFRRGPLYRRGDGFWSWQRKLAWLIFTVVGPACLLSAQLAATAAVATKRSQGQVSYQFVREVLRANFTSAYARLAPEVRRAVTLKRFEAAARPLWKSAQGRPKEIELYKLGVRLSQNGNSRLFYSFAFAADSALKPPPVLFEVIFRDTASRAVLGFGMHLSNPPVRVSQPVPKKRP